MKPHQQQVTDLLAGWNVGDEVARTKLLDVLHVELREIARRALSNERQDVLLQPTALVNEAYLKLVDTRRIDWQGRGHFLAVASKIMREILVDQARRRGAKKRDWGRQVTFTGGLLSAKAVEVDLLDLDAAMQSLAESRPDLCRLVELRFFGGLTIAECAQSLALSEATVKRRWRASRAWLAERLAGS